jgi:hypothetical protein
MQTGRVCASSRTSCMAELYLQCGWEVVCSFREAAHTQKVTVENTPPLEGGARPPTPKTGMSLGSCQNRF